MENSEVVKCPVCDKSFSCQKINDHVDECLNASSKDPKLPAVTKKRKSDESPSGWGFLMDKSHSSKRSKVVVPENNDQSDDVICVGESQKHKLITASSDRVTKSTNSPVMKISDTNSKGKLTFTGDPCELKRNAEAASKRLDVNKDTVASSCDIHSSVPLAEQMRPISFDEYIGQDKAVGQDRMLMKLLKSDTIPSMILWGPPGCGKVYLQVSLNKS